MRSVFLRTRYTGMSRYTHLVTGKQCAHPETMVIVQHFRSSAASLRGATADSCVMTSSYKGAYVSDNNIAYMKLRFAPAIAPTPSSPWPGPNNPIVLESTMSLDSSPQIGDLDAPYPSKISGQFEIYGPRPWHDFTSWRYVRYYGAPLATLFDDEVSNTEIAQGYAFYVDGRGHRCEGRFTRMMTYSIAPRDQPELRPVFMKTSELTEVDRVTRDVPFESFVE